MIVTAPWWEAAHLSYEQRSPDTTNPVDPNPTKFGGTPVPLSGLSNEQVEGIGAVAHAAVVDDGHPDGGECGPHFGHPA